VASALLNKITTNLDETDNLDNRAAHLITAAKAVITELLIPPPTDEPSASLPDYFSDKTKQAIKERDYAHQHSNNESIDNKAYFAKKAMRADKIINMNTKIADGSWKNTTTVRSKWSANPSCLLDKNNKLRGAADRATVIGEYLATEQFGRDPNHNYVIPEVLKDVVLAPGIYLDDEFTDNDLIRTLRQLKNGKSPKPNEIPNEI